MNTETEVKNGYIEPEMITMRKFKKMKLSRDAHRHNAEWFNEARAKAVKECDKYRKRIDELEQGMKEDNSEFAYTSGTDLYSLKVHLGTDLYGTIVRTDGDYHVFNNTRGSGLPAWMLRVLSNKLDDLDGKITLKNGGKWGILMTN